MYVREGALGLCSCLFWKHAPQRQHWAQQQVERPAATEEALPYGSVVPGAVRSPSIPRGQDTAEHSGYLVPLCYTVRARDPVTSHRNVHPLGGRRQW